MRLYSIYYMYSPVLTRNSHTLLRYISFNLLLLRRQQGNTQLGVSLLWSMTNEGATPFPFVETLELPTRPALANPPRISAEALGVDPNAPKKGAAAALAAKKDSAKDVKTTGEETDTLPASSVLPISAANLFPSVSDVSRLQLPNPLLAPGVDKAKVSVPSPVTPFPPASQKKLATLLQSPMGMAVLERCVHIARFNSVVAHGELPFYVPGSEKALAAPAFAGVSTSTAPIGTAPRYVLCYPKITLKSIRICVFISHFRCNFVYFRLLRYGNIYSAKATFLTFVTLCASAFQHAFRRGPRGRRAPRRHPGHLGP